MLIVDNIEVCLGKLRIIQGVSIEVRKNEVVALLGPNGSGKTTLLRSIVGALGPAYTRSGCVYFLNKRIDMLKPHQIIQLGLTIVPQERRLFTNMTVLENLELGAIFLKDKDELRNRMEYVFQLFPVLKERKAQLAGTLSGGEQQMLAIARGLMSKPKLLILDEPSLGLAPKIILQLTELINKIREDGVTILLAEQNLPILLKTAERGYILENGRVIAEGNLGELAQSDYIKRGYLSPI